MLFASISISFFLFFNDFNNRIIHCAFDNTTTADIMVHANFRPVACTNIDNGIIDGEGFDPDTFDPATWTEFVSFRQYEDYPAISTALSANEVQAFSVDKSILAIYNTDSRTYIEEEFAPQEYGIATTKGSGFSAVCEELVTGWLEDGTINGLIETYGLG